MSNGWCWERHRGAHLLLASLTLILGRARSSLSLWLCSDSLRSLSSDMDCFGTRPLMLTRRERCRSLRLCGVCVCVEGLSNENGE